MLRYCVFLVIGVKTALFLILATISSLVFSAPSNSEFTNRGDLLQTEVNNLLRSLRFPGTANTRPVNTTLAELLADFGSWKIELEDLLLAEQQPIDSGVTLINFYFQLVANLVQIKQLLAPPIDWSEWGRQFVLQAPQTIVWHRSPILQNLWLKKIDVIDRTAKTVRLQLKDTFVEGLEIATIAYTANENSHLRAVKYLIYTALYQQLVDNAFRRGEQATLPPAGYRQVALRERIINRLQQQRQQRHLQQALLTTIPQLSITTTELKKPLLKNWPLYQQLANNYPDNFKPFSTHQLAEEIYQLLDRWQKQAIAVGSSKQLYRYLLLVEHLLLPAELAKNLATITIDDSETSIRALQYAEIDSRASALQVVFAQLQLKSRTLQRLITERQLELRGYPLQSTKRWLKQAELIDDNKQFIAQVVDTAKHVANLDVTNKPINLAILRKALLHSLYTADFSGEVQTSLGAILAQQDYYRSREIFFQELEKHLVRLLPETKFDRSKLQRLSYSDLSDAYLKTALTRLEEHEQKVVGAIKRRAKINHIVQLKALLQYGYWFGYFSDFSKKIPTLEMLPLDKDQRKNYLQQLKFAYFDKFPFLLLEKNNRKLYQTLATVSENNDRVASLIEMALELQYVKIKTKLSEVDLASSLQDLKHIIASSPTISMGMREFAGIYPLHEQFIKQHSRPSRFHHHWQSINVDYIGNFFMVMIGYHLGGWMLRKSLFGTAGGHLLSWLSPVFGGSMSYAAPLLHGMWGVILVEYFVAMPYHTFVVKPQRLRELEQYYQLGNADSTNLVNGTLLNYHRLERNGHFVNYALEMSMHALFVGWWIYSLKFSHLIPKVKEKRLKNLFKDIGITSDNHYLFSDKKTKIRNRIKEQAKKQIINSGSQSSRRVQKIKEAEQKLLIYLENKEQVIKVALIEHKHDFAALGIEPVVDFDTINRAFLIIKRGFKAGIYSETTYRNAELAVGQLQLTLVRRLNVSQFSRQETSYQQAFGKAVAESLSPNIHQKSLDLALMNFYLTATGMQPVTRLKDEQLFIRLQKRLAGKFSDNPVEYYLSKGTFNIENLFTNSRFIGWKWQRVNATPQELSRLLAYLRVLGYDTRKMKTLADVPDIKAILQKKNAIIINYTRPPGSQKPSNKETYRDKKRNKINDAYANIESYLKRGYFKGES